ncbi:hypothetical protein [Polaribacter sp.]|uniref:hypothetical protein n=1 Tax=Polaribacter sp. TaxID=1920175 RepID=UPI003F4BE688
MFKNFLSSRQYSYLLSQFSNETYSKDVIASSVTGEIPAADILDLSVSYKHKFIK